MDELKNRLSEQAGLNRQKNLLFFNINEILNSLKPKGYFIYAPGIRQVEEYLDRDKYKVTVKAVIEEYRLSWIQKI